MKRRTKTLLTVLVAIMACAAIAWAATVDIRPYGLATPYWYGHSEGVKTDYYLSFPTLSANDEAVGKAATQTLTNKTLTSPTVTTPTITGGTQSATAESNGTYLTPTISNPVLHMTATSTAAELTITTSTSGHVYTNDGASAELTINWNTTTAGDMITIANAESYTLNVNPAGTVQILGLTNAAGDSIQSTSQGDSVQLYMINATQAVAVTRGTWSDVN